MEQTNELEAYQVEALKWTGKGFDLRTHIFDPKTGKVLKEQPYRMEVSKEHGTRFIRDHVHYSEQGQIIGYDAGFEPKVQTSSGPTVESAVVPGSAKAGKMAVK